SGGGRPRRHRPQDARHERAGSGRPRLGVEARDPRAVHFRLHGSHVRRDVERAAEPIPREAVRVGAAAESRCRAARGKITGVKPWELLGQTTTPDGVEMALTRRDGEYVILAAGKSLMSSRMHGSEEALATLACRRVRTLEQPCVLVGG